MTVTMRRSTPRLQLVLALTTLLSLGLVDETAADGKYWWQNDKTAFGAPNSNSGGAAGNNFQSQHPNNQQQAAPQSNGCGSGGYGGGGGCGGGGGSYNNNPTPAYPANNYPA